MSEHSCRSNQWLSAGDKGCLLLHQLIPATAMALSSRTDLNAAHTHTNTHRIDTNTHTHIWTHCSRQRVNSVQEIDFCTAPAVAVLCVGSLRPAPQRQSITSGANNIRHQPP